MSAQPFYLCLLLFSVASILCVGCGSGRVVQALQRDSIRVEVVPREVIIRDTVTIEIPTIQERHIVQQDSSLLQNEFATSEAVILPTGKLFHSLSTIPQKLSKAVATPVEVRDSIIYRERTITRYIEVPRALSHWQQLQLNGFWILLLLFPITIVVLK